MIEVQVAVIKNINIETEIDRGTEIMIVIDTMNVGTEINPEIKKNNVEIEINGIMIDPKTEISTGIKTDPNLKVNKDRDPNKNPEKKINRKNIETGTGQSKNPKKNKIKLQKNKLWNLKNK